MRKTLILIFLFSFSLIITESLKAEKYAILISAGKATKDDEPHNSGFWYDLFSAYELLFEQEGFTHNNIYVCYGNGVSFNSEHNCFKLSKHNWPEIVDVSLSKDNIESLFDAVAERSNNDDHIIIWWVTGHGVVYWEQGNTDPTQDQYYAKLEDGLETMIPDHELFWMINKIKHYSQRLVFWNTCHSGCLVDGYERLDGPCTMVSTACAYDEVSYIYGEDNPLQFFSQSIYITWLAGFLYGEMPRKIGPKTIFGSLDNNSDGYITMNEVLPILADTVKSQTFGPDFIEGQQHPQYAGLETVTNKVTISGLIPSAYLRLQNIGISGSASYSAFAIIAAGDNTYFRILNGGRVNMEAVTRITLLPGFSAREGSSFTSNTTRPMLSNDITHLSNPGDKQGQKDPSPEDTKSNDPEETTEEIPTVFSCSQNYPNPFNSSTKIKYGLPVDSDVSFCIYNLLGQKVKSVNMKQSAGYKSLVWDRTDDAGNMLGAGVYFFVLQAGDDYRVNKKMLALE